VVEGGDIAQWIRTCSGARRDLVGWRRDASQWSDTVAGMHATGQRHNVVECCSSGVVHQGYSGVARWRRARRGVLR
jgi:hypothetical protein